MTGPRSANAPPRQQCYGATRPTPSRTSSEATDESRAVDLLDNHHRNSGPSPLPCTSRKKSRGRDPTPSGGRCGGRLLLRDLARDADLGSVVSRISCEPGSVPADGEQHPGNLLDN